MPIHYASAEIVRFPQDDLGVRTNVYLVPAPVHRRWMTETEAERHAVRAWAYRTTFSGGGTATVIIPQW
jgi:hypothetical protein